MKLSAFGKDKGLLLLLHLVCMALLSAFLHITGYPAANITLICIFWLLLLSVWFLTTYLRRKSYFREAFRLLEDIDDRCLFGEMLPDSFALEDRLYREMIRISTQSVIEKIRALEDAQTEYREYLESWVHEIKTPISSIELLCGNAKNTTSGPETAPVMNKLLRDIRLENRKIENCMDMVLYQARSGQVYKDYRIRETDLREVVCEALEKDRLLLIRSGIQADVSCDETVFTDKIWIVFILNQLILNSVKYRSETPSLRFYTHRSKDNIVLTIEDNGTGIPAEDLPRIFEKGFTGSNGRDHRKATGMGLYLCKKLCDRLGILLTARSAYGKGTEMTLTFPVSSYIVRT
ncbi:sensor histidine kinase [Lachnospiraceae bacterium 38-10]